ncbi:Cytochrome P450_ family 2 subfamily J_ polypeptide 20, partial [Caligus rogercresseyi]
MAGRPQHFYTQHIKAMMGILLGSSTPKVTHGKPKEDSPYETEKSRLWQEDSGVHNLRRSQIPLDIIEILMSELFNGPIVNVIWQIIASTRCDHNNEQDRKILDGISSLLKGSYDPRFFVPALSWFLIEEHEENLDENAPNDFIDNYLIEMRLGKDPTFTKHQLVVICMDLFIAGSETSSTTLIWMVFFMRFHEDVQDKCFQEIKEGGRHGLTSVLHGYSKGDSTDGKHCPRSIFHVNLEDIEVEGYKIPKGNYFTANLRKFHFDPNVFEDPETFKPTRFYNKKLDPQF